MTEPMTDTETAWLLWFDDPDMRPVVFVGDGAESAARAAYARYSVGWTCTLFVDAEARAAAEAQVAELRAALEALVRHPLRDDFPDGGDIILRWPGNRADWEHALAILAATKDTE